MPTTNTSILKTTKKNIQEGKIFVALSRLRQACIYPWELAELTSQFQACLQHYALCTNSSQLPNSFNYTILINNNFDPQSNKNWQAFGEWISSKYGTCETDPLVTPVSFDRKSIELLLANILPNSKNLMHLASALAISQITNTPNLINKDWIDHAFSKDKIPNFFIRAITEWQIRSELASKILDLQASTISALFNSLSIQWDYFHSV